MFEEITNALAGAMGSVFSPILAFGPTVSIFILSCIVTLTIIAITRLITNKKAMDELKENMNMIKEQMTAAQKIGDTENASKFMKEMMDTNGKLMKHMYKGLFVSLIIVMLFLPFMSVQYEGMTVALMPFELPVIGNELTWIFWYVLVSFTIGWVVRKMLGMN